MINPCHIGYSMLKVLHKKKNNKMLVWYIDEIYCHSKIMQANDYQNHFGMCANIVLHLHSTAMVKWFKYVGAIFIIKHHDTFELMSLSYKQRYFCR